MSIIKTGASAIGRLITLGILLFAFAAGMAGVMYLSLSGEEVRVPEIVGKDFVESEKELAALGLKLKRRANRPSTEKINTVLEQLPRPGETVKTGQMILVVVASAGGVPEQTPESLKKDIESDDTEKIEEMISDKPKRTRTPSNSNANANTEPEQKKADTRRDVISNSAPPPANTGSGSGSETPKPDDTPRRDTPPPPPPTPKPQPTQAERPASGDTRPRTTPRPTPRP